LLKLKKLKVTLEAKITMPNSQRYPLSDQLLIRFYVSKTDYFQHGFSTIVTCAFLLHELSEKNTFKPRKPTISSTVL